MHDWLKRLGLRWITLSLLLYSVSITSLVPGIHQLFDDLHPRLWFVGVYTRLWFVVVVPWVGEHILHLPPSASLTGPEGFDNLANCVGIGCMLVLALVGAILWTYFDRDRQRERFIYECTRIFVRYTLAAVMLLYGFEKMLHSPWPYPGPSLLMTPVGDLAPSGLMWAFIGYSTLYENFAGLAEMIGGALLLFRQTTTLGALVLAGTMINVVMMDASFDFGVKFFAAKLMCMAIFLMAPDVLRLTPALVLGRAVAPVTVTRVWPKTWMGPASLVLKVLVIGLLLYYTASEGFELQSWIVPANKMELGGLYRVERFSSTGQSDPLLVSDGSLWQRVTIEPTTFDFTEDGGFSLHDTMTVRTADDAIHHFSLQVDRIDATHGQLILTRNDNAHFAPIVFRYVAIHRHTQVGSLPPPSNEALELDGKVAGAAISMRLDRLDANSYYLIRHKFSLIFP